MKLELLKKTNMRLSLEKQFLNKKTGKFRIIVYIYGIFMSIFIVHCVLFTYYNWGDVGKRLDGMKGLVMYVAILVYYIEAIYWDHSMMLAKIIENGLTHHLYRTTEEEAKVIHDTELVMAQTNTFWYYGTTSYNFFVATPIIVIFLIRLLQYKSSDIPIDTLHTSLPFYFPNTYNTLTWYVVVVLAQTTSFVFGLRNGYAVLVTLFNSIQLLVGELKLLTLSFKELDNLNDANNNRVAQDLIYKKSTDMQNSTNYENYILRDYLRYFVRRHYDIQRKTNDIKKAIRFVAFMTHTYMSFLICTNAYSIAKGMDIKTASQDGIFLFFNLACWYYYAQAGETVTYEGENLRRALYEYSWVDKPLWFKKSIQLIMTGTNRPVEMKFFGIINLNLRNFMTTVQAAYTYYNVLNNF